MRRLPEQISLSDLDQFIFQLTKSSRVPTSVGFCGIKLAQLRLSAGYVLAAANEVMLSKLFLPREPFCLGIKGSETSNPFVLRYG
jgi:hypothetical protein